MKGVRSVTDGGCPTDGDERVCFLRSGIFPPVIRLQERYARLLPFTICDHHLK
jgi:hypothetical protein